MTNKLLRIGALYVSSPAYDAWVKYKNHKHAELRRAALKSKCRSLIIYDRIISGDLTLPPV